MEINNKTIAVIIDFDNFNNDDYLNVLFSELEQMGNIIYKGAFYANTEDKKVEDKGIKYGINDFIIEPSYTKGKNAVDIRIALDTMELLNIEYIDCFCLATMDLDFAPIIKKLKQKNKVVIGAGSSKTKEEYKKLCHRFISVDTIVEASKPATEKIASSKTTTTTSTKKTKSTSTKIKPKNKQAIKIDELVEKVNTLIENNDKDKDGFIQFSVLIENLYKIMNDFNPKNYGFRNNKASLFFKEELKAYYEFKQASKTLYIKISK